MQLSEHLKSILESEPLYKDNFVHVKRLVRLCVWVCLPWDCFLWLVRVVKLVLSGQRKECLPECNQSQQGHADK